ncbi:MAG TPA: hypothetical protein PLP19_10315 [bacterium]|nr:hypothetical protein [bacterium]HPN43872.1 hypothetical protein [bacterium]
MKNKKLIILLFFFSLLFLISRTSCFANERRNEIIKILNTYSELNNRFLEINGKENFENYLKTKNKLEEYGENYYFPILQEMAKLICEKNDRDLLKQFLEILIKTSNSADETPTWTLGDIYLCQPDMTLELIAKLNNNPVLIDDLEWGFLNVTYQKESKIKNFTLLDKKLQNLIQLKSKKTK